MDGVRGVARLLNMGTRRTNSGGKNGVSLSAAGLCALIVGGCATVRPQADFEQTTTLISQRTGAVEVYDPSTEERVEQQVAAMLEDGLTIQEALVAARNAQEKVRFYREQAVPQAEVNIEAARRAYGGGEQSILVLIDAEESLITLRRASLDATLDFAVAVTELERAVGGRLPEAAEEPEKDEARDGSARGNN